MKNGQNIAKTATKTSLYFLKNFCLICLHSLHFSNIDKKVFNELLTYIIFLH